ncbi:sugar phosphate isomerase/epimerase family protein [Paenibacillus sp. NPDC057934]|uniref:sugar phosphate isomerase/epimerase family protein n=1 Tax=Paenibacillus sp. NPDC057934 TaxID=3346282 RepID=UPI0036DCE95A
MFKIAYNANGLRNMDVVKAIEEVKKYGYEGIELSLHKAHLHPYQVTEDKLHQIKQALKTQNLIPACLATGCSDLLSEEAHEPSLISPVLAERKIRIECIKKSIDIATKLNIPVVNISSGYKKETVGDEEARRYLIEGIQECLKEARDIILAIEPEPGMFIETTGQAIEIIEAVQSPKFKLNMDIGHVECCEDDLLDKIRKACKYSAHIHIEDIKSRVHYHLIPGDGDIDLRAVLEVLSSEQYEGFISVELYHHADIYEAALQKSYEYLNGIRKGIQNNGWDQDEEHAVSVH